MRSFYLLHLFKSPKFLLKIKLYLFIRYQLYFMACCFDALLCSNNRDDVRVVRCPRDADFGGRSQFQLSQLLALLADDILVVFTRDVKTANKRSLFKCMFIQNKYILV